MQNRKSKHTYELLDCFLMTTENYIRTELLGKSRRDRDRNREGGRERRRGGDLKHLLMAAPAHT